jgi:diguanylate cyclase (GGDEF)-like protein
MLKNEQPHLSNACCQHHYAEEIKSLCLADDQLSALLQGNKLAGVWYWDGVIPEVLWIDEQFWRTLGYEPESEDLTDVQWRQLVLENDRHSAWIGIQECQANPEYIYTQILQLKHCDGRSLRLRSRTAVIREPGGERKIMVSVFSEVDGNSSQTQSCMDHVRHLESAIKGAEIGIWKLDLTHNVLIWDEQMYRIYQQNPHDFVCDCDSWEGCIHPDDQNEFRKNLDIWSEGGANTHVDFRTVCPDGSVRYIRAHAQLIDEQSNSQILIGTNWDFSEFKSLEEKARQLAITDALTGLPNRNLLQDRLSLATARSRRSEDILLICMMDLDRFKPINDSFGHEIGDKLLQEVAHRIQVTLRPEDTVLRLGGDEFVLLIGGFKAEYECEAALKRLLDVVAHPYVLRNEQVSVTASIGATLFPSDSSVEDQLLRHADQAMYRAKAEGKNRYYLYDPTLESRHKANLNTINRIRKALAEGQLELYYQPQVDCQNGRIIGVEALLRWNHPLLGVRMPGEFLPLIEHDEVSIDIGEWVLETATRQLEIWQQLGLGFRMGVNISASHLLNGNIDQKIEELTQRYSKQLLGRIELEVVETAALEDMKKVGSILTRLQSIGIRFALDDFGTGFSSLSHLKHLAVDTMKVDRSFIRDMLDDPGDFAIIQGIKGLSMAFHSQLIAEGVETIDQIMFLLGNGINVMQGYALARPMPADKCLNWINHFNANPVWDTAKGSYPSRLDFDLLLIEVTHKHWLEQVKKSIRYAGKGDKTDTPTPYSLCKTTRWCHSDSVRKHCDKTKIPELDGLHQDLHYFAEDVLSKDLENISDSMLQQLISRLEERGDQFVEGIREFRKSCV